MRDPKFNSRKYRIAIGLMICTTLLAVLQIGICKELNFIAVAGIFCTIGAGYNLANTAADYIKSVGRAKRKSL